MHTLRCITTEGMWLHLQCNEMNTTNNRWGVCGPVKDYISVQMCWQGEGKERDPSVFFNIASK